MEAQTPSHLAPRKKPIQARAAVTVDAIFEATIQVLLADGVHKLTTTRVAERAGVSVGTMYQYFAHKQALLYALNERYLDVLAGKVEKTSVANRGVPIRQMVETLIDTYWQAKMERADVTRVLYASAVELDNEALIAAFVLRVDAATTSMFTTAPDARFADISLVNTTLLSVIFGTVRSVFQRNLSASLASKVHEQLLAMCLSYLEVVNQSRDGVRDGNQPDASASNGTTSRRENRCRTASWRALTAGCETSVSTNICSAATGTPVRSSKIGGSTTTCAAHTRASTGSHQMSLQPSPKRTRT